MKKFFHGRGGPFLLMTMLALGLSLAGWVPRSVAQGDDLGQAGTATHHDVRSVSDLPALSPTVLPLEAGPSVAPEIRVPDGAGGSMPRPSPRPSIDFPAVLDDGSKFTPNSAGAVGRDHVMAATSSEVSIKDRNGTELSRFSLQSFWTGYGTTEAVDPRLIYDPYSQRFILVCTTEYIPTNSNPGLLIAVSQTPSALGAWNRYFIDVDVSQPVYGREPNVGFNKDWIVVTLNMFSKSNNLIATADIFAFNKTNLYNNGAGLFTRFARADLGDTANIPVPAVTFDPTLNILYLVQNYNSDFEGFGFLRVLQITGPVNSPVFSIGELIGDLQGVPGWEDYALGDVDFARQLGTTNRVYLNDGRLRNVVLRNSTLWMVHNIWVPQEVGPSYSAIQWWEATPGGNIYQRGSVSSGFNDGAYGCPSIAVNSDNDMLIGYTRFAPYFYPSAYYVFRMESEDPLHFTREESYFRAGQASFYVPDLGVNRWGEWSSTVVDPLNDAEFWTLQEYAEFPQGGEDRWGTHWARISPPQNLAVIRLTDSPDPVIAGANVTASVVVTNLLPRVANGVRIVDTLPQGATFVSATASQGSCTFTNGVVTCHLGVLLEDAGANATIVFSPGRAGLNTNSVTVLSNGPDTDSSNNTLTGTTTVTASADLAVTQIVNPNPVVVGSNLTFGVIVTNRGPSSATAVTMTDNLPAGVTYVSAVSAQGSCSRNGSVITCNIGSLASASAILVNVTVSGTGPGTVTNRASVSTTSADGNLLNNTNLISARIHAVPTIQVITNRVIDEDGVLGPLTFTVADTETPAASLVVTATSSNLGLVPAGGISLGGTGGSRTITVTPLPDQTGVTTITRTVRDGDGATNSSTFTLTVNPVNDRPLISDIGNQSTAEETVTSVIAFVVGDAETPAGSLVVSASSSSSTLVPPGNFAFVNNGANRTVRITPAPDQFGTATITVTVTDGLLSAMDTFVLTVTPANDLPTITGLVNRAVNEDASTGPIAVTIGDLETAAGSLQFSATSSDPVLIPAGNITPGGTGANRTLTIIPAANLFGSATITVRVIDAEMGTNTGTFVLTVAAVNDAPTLNTPANVVMAEDANTLNVSLSNISSGAANETDSVTISATSSNPALIPHPPVSYTSPSASGSLALTPVANINGSATITVTVNDQRATNNVLVRTFSVTVSPVNDAPVISDFADQIIDEDTSTPTLFYGVLDHETLSGSLMVRALSSNPALVPVPNVGFGDNGDSRFVRILPAPNQSGLTRITIIVSDGAAEDSTSFNLTVNPINDPPILFPFTDTEVPLLEDMSSGPLSFYAFDAETTLLNSSFRILSSNPTLLPAANVVVQGTGEDRTVTFTPASNRSGSAFVSVSVTDDRGEVGEIFYNITVTAVNDTPTLNAIGNVSVDEDSGPRLVSLDGISSGGGPEENQSLTVVATSDNPAVVPQPQLSYANGASGSLTFTPQPDRSGTANIAVTVRDNGSPPASLTRTFVVTVRNINDAPTITAFSNRTTPEDTPILNIPFVVGDAETPLNELTLIGFSSNEDLLGTAGITFGGFGANRTLNIRPHPNQSGSASVVVLVYDIDGEVMFSSFELDVTTVNDLPTISRIVSQTFNEERRTATFDFTIGDAESAPAELILTMAASDLGLLPPGSLSLSGSGTTRQLVVTPATDRQGDASVLLTLRDSQGGTFVEEFGVSVRFGPVLHIVRQGVNASLNWSTNYPDHLLQRSDDMLAGGSWQTIMAAGGRVGNQFALALPMDNISKYYRLIEVPPPIIAAIDAQNVVEDGSVQLNVLLSDTGGASSASTLVASASDGLLLPTSAFSFMGTGDTRSLRITPASNRSGNTVVTLTVTDAIGRTGTQVFQVVVAPVNDMPSFLAGANENVTEDAAPRLVSGWATAFSVGPSDETGQALEFVVSNDNSELFSVQPGISPSGVLSYTVAANGAGSATVTVRLRDNGGVANGGQDTSPPQTFAITVNAVNDAPFFAAGSAPTVLEDAGAQTLPGWATGISAGAPNESGQALTFEASHDNPALFSVPPALSPTGALTFTPAPNAHGVATVTVRLRDNGGAANGGQDSSPNQVFTITVLPVNDVPSLVAGADQNILEDAGVQTIPGWATGVLSGPANEAGQGLAFLVSNDNPSLFSVSPAINAAGTLTYTPAPNFYGTATVDVQLRDDGGTANGGQDITAVHRLTITIANVNDPPSFSESGNQSILEDAGPQTVNNWATGMSAGPANESSQGLSFVVGNNNNALFSVQPAVGVGGILTYTPAVNANGSATVNVRLQDDGGTANGGQDSSPTVALTITVTPVNDAPSFAVGSSPAVNEDAGPQTLVNWATGVTAGPADESGQTLTFIVNNDNNALFTTQPAVGPSGTLSFTPALNAHGSANVQLRLDDNGGTANGGNNTTALQAFTITVEPVNDAPTLLAVGDEAVDEDSASRVINLDGISSGGADEPQNLTVTAVSSAPLIVAQPQVSYSSPNATGTLTFTPVPDADGSANITVTVDDGGASNNIVTRTFTVTVRGVNDQPTITTVAAQRVDEDQSTPALVITVGDIETAAGSLTLEGASSNPGLVSPSNIFFEGVGSARTVRVLPITNQVGNADIIVTVRDSNGGSNGFTFNLEVTAINDAPTVTGIGTQIIDEDATTGALNFTIGDVDSPLASLTVEHQSSNTNLIPTANVILGGTGAARTVTVTPVAEASGSSTISLLVSDGSLTNTLQFLVTVNPVNDLPTLALIDPQQTDEDTVLSVSLNVGDPDSALAALTVTATAANTTLVPNANLSVTGAGATRTLVLLPGTNQFGNTTVTVTVNDGTTPVSRIFNLAVSSLEDPPTMNSPSGLTINEDASLQTVNLSGISAGAANEGQAVTIVASSSNPTLIPTPAVNYSNPSATGTLTFTPVANRNGSAVITLTVSDGVGQLERSFLVVVLSVEDPPSVSDIANVVVLEDTPVTINFVATDPDTDPFRMVLTGASSNTNLLPTANIRFEGDGTNRTVTLVPRTDQSGTATVVITATDGTVGATDSFVVTVIPVNDPPTMDVLPDVALVAGAGDYDVNLSGIGRGPANETAGNLVVLATSSNTSIVTIRARTYSSPAPTGVQKIRPGIIAGTTEVNISVSDSQPSNNVIARIFRAYVRLANNNPPTISGLSNQTIPEDGTTGAINFTVGDVETPAASLSLIGQSSDPLLIPAANITFGGGGANRTVTVVPALNRTGTANISVLVVDAGSGMSSLTFSVTVTPGNDTPTITGISDQMIALNGSSEILRFTVSDVETLAGALTVTASSSNQGLLPDANIILGGPGSTRALRLTPTLNQAGIAVVTLTVSDGNGGVATTMFAVRVSTTEGPLLRISRLSSSIARISWPSSAGGYSLQSRTPLTSGPGWSAVAATPSVIANEYVVDVSTTGPERYYRLAQ